MPVKGLCGGLIRFPRRGNSPLYVKPSQLRWDIGFPVPRRTRERDGLVVKRFSYHKVAATVHSGPYYTTYQTIKKLYAWIAKKGYRTVGGPCVELYHDKPRQRGRTPIGRTEIWIPIR